MEGQRNCSNGAAEFPGWREVLLLGVRKEKGVGPCLLRRSCFTALTLGVRWKQFFEPLTLYGLSLTCGLCGHKLVLYRPGRRFLQRFSGSHRGLTNLTLLLVVKKSQSLFLIPSFF